MLQKTVILNILRIYKGYLKDLKYNRFNGELLIFIQIKKYMPLGKEI